MKNHVKDNGYILCGSHGQDTGMSTNEITALCLNILLAATEPTDKALAMMFKHLISNPSMLDVVVKDRSLVRAAHTVPNLIMFTS
ncbi:cytochrome P450 [Photorhabdus heterorhabditis]|uniref:cytochrome P450 n=1 Tax=Photorhabdus heterorhabditis TaxID=880156 RepID=UPI0020B74E30|nr:cytochrome P450 [Photorhabdus heterorhabditis]